MVWDGRQLIRHDGLGSRTDLLEDSALGVEVVRQRALKLPVDEFAGIVTLEEMDRTQQGLGRVPGGFEHVSLGFAHHRQRLGPPRGSVSDIKGEAEAFRVMPALWPGTTWPQKAQCQGQPQCLARVAAMPVRVNVHNLSKMALLASLSGRAYRRSVVSVSALR